MFSVPAIVTMASTASWSWCQRCSATCLTNTGEVAEYCQRPHPDSRNAVPPHAFARRGHDDPLAWELAQLRLWLTR
jgi:hypothetical protein